MQVSHARTPASERGPKLISALAHPVARPQLHRVVVHRQFGIVEDVQQAFAFAREQRQPRVEIAIPHPLRHQARETLPQPDPFIRVRPGAVDQQRMAGRQRRPLSADLQKPVQRTSPELGAALRAARQADRDGLCRLPRSSPGVRRARARARGVAPEWAARSMTSSAKRCTYRRAVVRFASGQLSP